MKKNKEEWTKAEVACARLVRHNWRRDAFEIGKQLLEDLEPEINPIFPKRDCFVLVSSGQSVSVLYISTEDKQGNTFETRLLADEEELRRAAETRVREKINIANKGDNGFKANKDNHCIIYDATKMKAGNNYSRHYQSHFPWEYFRDLKGVDALLKDKQFVKDWLLMKGIKQ